MGIIERKEREKEERHNSIIDAAENVFFSKGVANSTMDEVAEEAELSKGTIYLYFKSKDDLYHAIILRGLNILYSMFEKAITAEKKGIDKVQATGRAYFDFFKNHSNYFEAMLHQETHKIQEEREEESPHVFICNEAGNRIFSLLQKIIKEGIEDGSLNYELDPLKLSIILWGHASGIMQVMKAKGEMIQKMFGVGSEELITYSFNLMRCYLGNGVQG